MLNRDRSILKTSPANATSVNSALGFRPLRGHFRKKISNNFTRLLSSTS